MATKNAEEASSKIRNMQIQLTQVEQTLRQLLLDVVDFIQQAPSKTQPQSQVALPPQLASEKTVLRFTGGWVRDKLLGQESHDVDVAINNMTGEQFGLRMKDYLEDPGNAAKYGLDGVAKTDAQSTGAGVNGKSKLVGGLHKIEANPEKSKHLETVTTRILGLDIDLVNLRKETYTDDSRNPQIEFGTPEEDAMRRDATINAMFFNLNTLQVEDFTNQGFNDLQARIIRTPLEPYQTFRDDPLRVLRLIRFASRFDYSIDPQSSQSMKNEDIKTALRLKISRERVGVELEKMLKGPRPLNALLLIDEAGLYSTVFSDPSPGAFKWDPQLDGWVEAIGKIDKILSEDGSIISDLFDQLNDDDRYGCWVMACLTPFQGAPQPPGLPGKKLPPPMATNVAREGFKATNKICDLTTASMRNSDQIKELVKRGKWDKVPTPEAREVLGMAIRKWGPTWRLQVLFCMFGDIQDTPGQDRHIVAEYSSFAQRIRRESLGDARNFRPLLDGKQLAKAIGISPGPWMKDALDVVMQWQLRNPDSKSTDEAVEEVKNSKVHGELSADLVRHFLQLTVRPLFVKNQPRSVTDQGRRNTSHMPNLPMDVAWGEESQKPWKNKAHQALPILHWVVKSIDSTLLEQVWHLTVPPLLALVDDHEVTYKAQGCASITTLLQKTPNELLAKTGLFDVFREALLPCFGFLPTLTPEAESAGLLSNVFPALLALTDTAFPINQAGSPVRQRKVQFLDILVRKGVLATYSHCPESVVITQILLENLQLINDALGLESVKHLKHVLPMLNEILCSPFGSASPDLLLTALRGLQSTIRNCWPRMADCKGEILMGLTTCWIHAFDGEGGKSLQVFREEAKQTAEMLKEAVGMENGLRADLEMLIDADDRLRELLLPDP